MLIRAAIDVAADSAQAEQLVGLQTGLFERICPESVGLDHTHSMPSMRLGVLVDQLAEAVAKGESNGVDWDEHYPAWALSELLFHVGTRPLTRVADRVAVQHLSRIAEAGTALLAAESPAFAEAAVKSLHDDVARWAVGPAGDGSCRPDGRSSEQF